MKSVDLDPAILEQAAEWMLQVQAGEASEIELEEIAHWRTQNTAHELAWNRAERFMGAVKTLPAELAQPILNRPASASRRLAIKKLALVLALSPAAWLAYRSSPWTPYVSDMHTALGEQRSLVLADGSKLTLNSSSSIDIVYSSSQRLVILREGEIHISTTPDSMLPARPFLVQTREGSSRALGTKFTVRQWPEKTHIAVYEGAVEIAPHAAAKAVIQAGHQASFYNAESSQHQPIPMGQDAWLQSMYVANNQPLLEVLHEFQRHQRMLLRCHPQVAQLRVSGIFSLANIDKNLDVLQGLLPIRISKVTQYWVTISPA